MGIDSRVDSIIKHQNGVALSGKKTTVEMAITGVGKALSIVLAAVAIGSPLAVLTPNSAAQGTTKSTHVAAGDSYIWAFSPDGVLTKTLAFVDKGLAIQSEDPVTIDGRLFYVIDAADPFIGPELSGEVDLIRRVTRGLTTQAYVLSSEYNALQLPGIVKTRFSLSLGADYDGLSFSGTLSSMQMGWNESTVIVRPRMNVRHFVYESDVNQRVFSDYWANISSDSSKIGTLPYGSQVVIGPTFFFEENRQLWGTLIAVGNHRVTDPFAKIFLGGYDSAGNLYTQYLNPLPKMPR